MHKIRPTGPLDAPIAFVGEAPGMVEIRRGIPFVGPTGRLFNKLLEGAGIIRSRCYITNVVKEDLRAIKVDISRKNPVLSPEYLAYEESLREELSQTTSNVIVAIGNLALWALCRKTNVTKRRGSILESTLLPGRKVIPIIHPSAAFHQYIFQHYIAIDLRRVREESRSPNLNLPERTCHLTPSMDEALGFLHRLSHQPRVSYDIEVIRQELSHIAFGLHPLEGMCIPFMDEGRPYFTKDQERIIMIEIAKILQDPKVEKIAQNAIFDSSFLFRKYGIPTVNLHDTMIAQAILAPDWPKGLDFLTSVNTREPYYKDEGKQYMKLIGDEMSFRLYNVKDALVTFEIWLTLERDLRRQDNWLTYVRQRDLIYPLTYMFERGTLLDTEGLKNQSSAASIRLAKIEAQVQAIASEHGVQDLNLRSSKQLKEYFYGVRGLKPYHSRSTGNVTTDEKALKRIARKGFKEAYLILEHRGLAKLQGTYYNIAYDPDERIRSSYNPVGATSGRLSSSKTIFGTGANMQNQPAEMKQYFLADPGYLIYEMDLSQAENRVVAYIAPEPKLIKAFEDGIDVHSLTASMIFREPIEQIIVEDKQDIFCDIGRGTNTKRFWGKKANHSFGYGEGYKRFAIETEIPERDAKFIRERWHESYPGIDEYWRWVRDSIHRNRTLINPFGRKRTFMDRLGDDLYKAAYSFIPQSTVADIINEHGILYIYRNQELFEHVELLNQVHDSIVFQIPIAMGSTYHLNAIRRIQDSLTRPIQFHNRQFQIPVETKVSSTTLGDMTKITEQNKVETLRNLCQESTRTG